MTTADPISLAQTRRLAANADTILLRATRPGGPRDADRGLPPSRRRRAGVPPRIGRGRRAPGPLLLPGRGTAPPARRPRRASPASRPGRSRSRSTRRTCRSRRCRRPIRWPRSAASCRADASSRPRACRGSPAERSARLPTTRSPSFEPSVPLPDRDPVRVPIAAFIETDLVLVFDHLTHTLSAIASLHTETPDLEGRYRIAEAAIFEALERTVAAQPGRDERHQPAPGNGGRAGPDGVRSRGSRRRSRSRPAWVATSTSTRSGSPRTPSRRVRRSRSCWLAASRSTCRPTPRPAPPSTGSGSTAPCDASTRARTCSSSGRPATRSSAPRPSCSCRSRATA